MQQVILQLDEEFEKDIASGKGFVIDTPIPVNKKEFIRDERGIYSSLFGGDITDISELQKKYSCACGKTVGKFRDGTICDYCHTPVTFQDDDLDKIGYMILREPYKLINPKMYKFLENVFKAKVLNDIIKRDVHMDKHGKIEPNVHNSKNKYENIGLVEFANKFDEIFDALADKNKIQDIKFIQDNKHKIFVSHIPVLSLLLRPVVLINGSTFNYDPLNKSYAEMISNVSYINKNFDPDIQYQNLDILYSLQKLFNLIDDEIIKNKINGKKHAIRSFILGSRINFSARQVLIPNNDTVQMDSLVIPYITFVEFYKFHIMNIYRKLYNITMNELNDRWYYLTRTQDPSIMNIINMLIKNTKGGMRVYTNRNPTLSWGSSSSLQIIGINKDIDDLTMRMPPNICPMSNADFDGDTLNTSPLIEKSFADKFNERFNPERLVISLSTGKFNRKVNLLDDQLVGAYSFFNDDFDPEDFDGPDDNFSVLENNTRAMTQNVQSN